MATERQIEANRRNAALSTGPKSERGKARSRANATRHGLASESGEVEAGWIEARESAAFRERRESWGREYRPSGEAAGWALDRVVAASLRIERCERTLDDLAGATAARARLAWDEDRFVEAETLASGLARSPGPVSSGLAASYHGSMILIETWRRLAACLEAEGGWTEAEASTALDLLGLPADLRRGPTPIDPPGDGDALAHRRALVAGEIGRLEARRDGSLAELDDLDRERAEAGGLALAGKEAKLVLRYERDAWRRYREALRDLRSPALAAEAPPPPAPVVARPEPAIAPAPGPPPRPPAPPKAEPAPTVDADLARLLISRGIDPRQATAFLAGPVLPIAVGRPPGPA